MSQYIRSLFTKTALQQLIKVGVVGVVNTVVSVSLFNLLLDLFGGTKTVDEGFNWEQFWAIAIAFIIATLVSYALNRRWTFQLSAAGDLRRETTNFVVINMVAWMVTQGVVGGADLLWGPLTRFEQNLFYIAASGVIIVPKFAGYRDIVFRRALDALEPLPTPAAEEDEQSVATHLPQGGERKSA